MHQSNNFHFLRFLAASLVVVGHYFPLTGQSDAIEQWSLGLFPSGHIAVCVFFVISGYCVTQSKLHTSSTFSYLMKRVLRIFPGLLVALCFTAFVVGPIITTYPLREYFSTTQTYHFLDFIKLYPPNQATLPGVFSNNPHTQANGSLWTLAYEFTMYLFLVVACFIFAKRWGLFVLLFLAFFSVFCFFYPHFLGNRTLPFLHLNLFHIIDFGIYFVLGMLAYIYRNSLKYNWRGVLFAFGAWMGMYFIADAGYLPLAAITWVRYFSVTYLVLYFAFQKGVFNHFGKMGDYSYGIYIYAFPIQQSIVAILGKEIPMYQHVLLAFALILPLSWFSWQYVEKPAIKLKKVFH